MWDFVATRRWQNALSFRALVGAVIVAAIPAVIASMAWKPLGTVVFLAAFPAWMLWVQMDPGQMLYCDRCRKRVKAAADTCHHCGYTVGQDAGCCRGSSRSRRCSPQRPCRPAAPACGKFDAAHQCSPRIPGLCGKAGAKPVDRNQCAQLIMNLHGRYCVLKPTDGSRVVDGAGP